MENKETKQKDNILIVYYSKETGEYKRFETVGNYDKETVLQKIEQWNSNADNKELVKVYDDPLLFEMAKDVGISRNRNWVIGDMKDCIEDIRRSIRNLEELQDSINDMLNDLENDKEEEE